MWKNFVLIFGLMFLAGCSTSPSTGMDTETNSTVIEKHPNDPLERFNRAMWTVNYDYLDPYLLRPVSLAYVDYVPSFIRTGIRNFLTNLEEPFKVVNNLISLDGKAALRHFNRFWINSSFGLAGILDIAGKAGEPPANDKQFGDVLGFYGVGHGPFFMLPGVGPLTLREGVGDTIDGLYPVMSLLTWPQSLLKSIFDGMETRASLVNQESLLNSSPDPYAFVRDAYLQNKAFTAGQTEDEFEADDSFLSEELLNEIDGF